MSRSEGLQKKRVELIRKRNSKFQPNRLVFMHRVKGTDVTYAMNSVVLSSQKPHTFKDVIIDLFSILASTKIEGMIRLQKSEFDDKVTQDRWPMNRFIQQMK